MSGSGESAVFDGDLVDRYRARASAIRDEVPDEGTEGWFRADFDASRLIGVYPSLDLRPHYKLVTWIYRIAGNGNGLVLAFPEDDLGLPPALTPPGVPVSQADIPGDDTRHPMHAIAGDGSLLAALSASLLFRELSEVGALWHGVGWDVEEIICTRRSRLYGATRAGLVMDRWRHRLLPMDWEGSCPDPNDLAPSVFSTPTGYKVTFHTYSQLGRDHVTRHIDTLTDDSLVPRCESYRLAVGFGGFVF